MCFELFQFIMCVTVALRAHILECCTNGTRIGALWSPLLHPACMAEQSTVIQYDEADGGWSALVWAMVFIGALMIVSYKVTRCMKSVLSH